MILCVGCFPNFYGYVANARDAFNVSNESQFLEFIEQTLDSSSSAVASEDD